MNIVNYGMHSAMVHIFIQMVIWISTTDQLAYKTSIDYLQDR